MASLKPSYRIQRKAYRLRRVADAARLLPILGTLLMIMPLLWGNKNGGVLTSQAIFYLFGIWIFFVVLAGIFSNQLKSEQTRSTSAPQPPQDT